MSQLTVLAFETATSACSVALAHAGKVSQLFETGNNIHSQRVLAMADSLLRETGVAVKQLDAVAVGQGPGSFTGLRIGVGVAQGIAYAVSCPMVGVSSLAALALKSTVDGVVLAGIDARMQEIYWGLYQKAGDRISLIEPHQVGPASAVPVARADALVGNAWQEYKKDFDSKLLDRIQQCEIEYPTAESILALALLELQNGGGASPIEFAPEYVRNSVAKKAVKK